MRAILKRVVCKLLTGHRPKHDSGGSCFCELRVTNRCGW